ncbi:hypothetical protein JNUCC1_01083 [Lentibacillus sp. JNUCC-1]|uniref:winged helix-turn-helix domain-containing protein n=1 Tax=Lentibacillus sp. JNUCC-1 TaxID=2654513 RepID=UPI00132795E8|nr:winged helix-turn-helix domain-containing protein [Lentibacillus sp. JNUCC-1]MUV37277.1 hypothetical protein [Lentibacillus sp. JNUCC-1]
MSTIHVVHSDTVKQLNRSLILKEIRKFGPITKIDIAKKFGLTFPAVGNIVADLLKAGVIEEAGYGESRGADRRFYTR